MTRVFIVAGKTGSRKSSTIRALTGIGSGVKVFQIMQVNRNDDDNGINVYVHHVSLQEKYINHDVFINQVEENEDASNVLVALRIDEVNRRNGDRFGSAQEYIKAFIEDGGWKIAGVAVLGEENQELLDYAPQGSSLSIPDATQTPANDIANQIRERWHWR